MLHQTLPFGLTLLLIFSKTVSAELKPYVVYMGAQSFGPDPTLSQLNQVTESHQELLASFVGSVDLAGQALIHSYRRVINGFAAILTEQDAERIAQSPGVVSVFPNEAKKLHTTHSWEFMALENKGIVNPTSLWSQAKYGEDVILANLDTGVWPESKSFNDEGYGPIPSRWRGGCENNTKNGVTCNKKLIGAKFFNKAYLSIAQLNNISVSVNNSTRDTEGHGSHTLSTAGGNFVSNASVFSLNTGTAKGGAPRARLVAYKVCWPEMFLGGGSCIDSDMMQAFVQAVLDGVDVISMSVGGPPADYMMDSIAIGSFTAVKAGIVVVCSAGNSGPTPGSVANAAPWIIAVAASTIDREFQANVETGSGLVFKGASLSAALPENKLYPLISGANARKGNSSSSDAMACMENTLSPRKVKGKIVVCLRGVNGRVEKGQIALLAGAAGMILCNNITDGNDLTADAHVLPAAHINYADGQALFNYVNSDKNPVGFITPPTGATGMKPSPTMAAFSSRGPNIITPHILKPDITAPGVNIIAAYTEAPAEPDSGADTRITPYFIQSGTSMSCPHVAGIVTVLKKVHPDWSGAAIKSAIMTTARTQDNTGKAIRDHDMKQATPFSYGAGHINPNRVMDPGLVYDLTITDYLNFLCASGFDQNKLKLFTGTQHVCPESFSLLDFNYPSISAPNISGTVTATRKVKNVGAPGTYTAKVVQPVGVTVTVEPSELNFDKVGEEKMFKVIFAAKEHNLGLNSVFGKLTWSDGKHTVKSPIVASVLKS